jgi:hypothetical protein
MVDGGGLRRNESCQIQLNPEGGSAPANKTKPPGSTCCHSVATLLPVLLPLKCLTYNDVADVATLWTAIIFYLEN